MSGSSLCFMTPWTMSTSVLNYECVPFYDRLIIPTIKKTFRYKKFNHLIIYNTNYSQYVLTWFSLLMNNLTLGIIMHIFNIVKLIVELYLIVMLACYNYNSKSCDYNRFNLNKLFTKYSKLSFAFIIHTYIHTFINKFIHTFIRTYIRTYTYLLIIYLCVCIPDYITKIAKD